ncbi:hypothetical protein ACWGS9_00595 [Bradyrhizobium sp. Arg314]
MSDRANRPKKGDGERKGRLAEALRANLQKRKAQARSRRVGDVGNQRAGDADKLRARDADKLRARDADKQRARDADKQRARDPDDRPEGLPAAGKMHKD